MGRGRNTPSPHNLFALFHADYFVAGVVDRSLHGFQIGARVGHRGRLVGQVNRHIIHTLNAAQRASHARDTVASGHAGNLQYRLAHLGSLPL